MGNGTKDGLCENAVGHSVSEDAAELHCGDATDSGEFGNCNRTLGRYVFGNGKVMNDVQGGDIK